jgi:hypothetical protein
MYSLNRSTAYNVLYPAKIVEEGTSGGVAKKINTDPPISNIKDRSIVNS